MTQSSRSLVAVLIILWSLPLSSAQAFHMLNNGLPERPPKEGEPPVKLFDWHLYAQGRFTHTEKPDNRFALRRLKLNGGGHFKDFKYFAQGIFKVGNDSETDGEPFLQEVWVQYEFSPKLRLTAGQFKPSFGMERFTSDTRIFLIDRAQTTTI